MTRLRMRVADRLKGAQNTYAMLTTFNEVDMTALMEMRNQYKVRCALPARALRGCPNACLQRCVSTRWTPLKWRKDTMEPT